MNKNHIISTLKSTIINVLPELNEDAITLENSLKNLGANSIDRAEILMDTIAQLGIKIDLIQFGNARNIGEIIEILEKNCND